MDTTTTATVNLRRQNSLKKAMIFFFFVAFTLVFLWVIACPQQVYAEEITSVDIVDDEQAEVAEAATKVETFTEVAETAAETETEAAPFEPHRAFVSESVNIYLSPDEDAEVISSLAQWQEVFIEEEIDETWCRIRSSVEGESWYIFKEYVQLTKPVNEEDVQLLAKALYCEAGGEGIAEMTRVGHVILNRIETTYGEFPETTLVGVISHKGQYPVTWKKIQRGTVYPSDAAYAVARQLLDGTIDRNAIYAEDGTLLTANTLWQVNATFASSKVEWSARTCNGKGHYYGILK